MPITEASLKQLISDVEEARGILQKRAEVERDLQQAEKRLGRVQGELAAAKAELESVKAATQAANAHYDHERARFASDLKSFQEQCNEKKRAEETAAVEALRSIRYDLDTARDRCATEKRTLEAEIASLQKQRNDLQATARDFKARVQTLLG